MREDLARLMHHSYFSHHWRDEDEAGQELWRKVADSVIAYMELPPNRNVTRREENEACAKLVEGFKDKPYAGFDGESYWTSIERAARAIRERMEGTNE